MFSAFSGNGCILAEDCPCVHDGVTYPKDSALYMFYTHFVRFSGDGCILAEDCPCVHDGVTYPRIHYCTCFTHVLSVFR